MAEPVKDTTPTGRGRRGYVWFSQGLLLAGLIVAWQFLPQVPALQRSSHFLDPYFISSPTRIAELLIAMSTGREGSAAIWPYLWPTLAASVLGTVIGMSMGALVGLVLSNFSFLSRVMRPFIAAINAIPRIALIPIVILLFGPTFSSSIVVSVMVVFFVAFFNAYEGGLNVPPELLQNARLLNASEWTVLRRIRLPYVLAWTLAVLPLGATFAIISVVTAEILSGSLGIGRLLATATQTADSTLTFALVVVLSVMGLVVLSVADFIKLRVLHWWGR